MKPKDISAYRDQLDRIARTEQTRRVIEEQLKIYERVNQQIARTMMSDSGVHAMARVASEVAKTLAVVDKQWLKQFELPSATAEVIKRVGESQAFNTASLSAARAAARAVTSINQIHGVNIAKTLSNLSRVAASESLASLTSAFASQLKSLEEQQSGFARSMAQTLQTAFEGFEGRNLESLANSEASFDKI